MATPDQLAAQVRFALANLAGRNGHHEFEELCRHLTRQRICTNVLPATGPVAAGGDQGRDFETFRTHLAAELGTTGAFLGRASDKTIVFTCTLQEANLHSKIVEDAEKVCTQGEPVDEVYAFCVAELPIGRRHRLQETVRERFGVRLEVLDGRAIAEHLADYDLFWVAERYLSLPAELRPARLPGEPELPDWYLQDRAKWQQRTTPPRTIGDLLDIKGGLRHATFTRQARGDLSFWLTLARQFLDDQDMPLEWRQRARYEIAVAILRGQGTLIPGEDAVTSFFATAMSSADTSLLHDGSVLLMYCCGAIRYNVTTLDAGRVREWNDQLRQRVRDLLGQEPAPNRRAALLQTLGHLAAHPDLPSMPSLGAGDAADEMPDVADLMEEPGQLRSDLSVKPDPDLVLVDLEEAMTAWVALAGLLEEASMFPVESFAEQVALLAPLLVDHPAYRDLTNVLDERVAQVAGRAAAAAKCRDRASALLDSERVRAALHELHQAKVDWWSGDTLRGSLLAMLLIAECYERLHLPAAAKYYAHAIAGLAQGSGDDDLLDLVPDGLLLAAHLDYVAGAWCSATELTEVGLMAQGLYVENGLDPSAHSNLERVAFEQAIVLDAARQVVPELVSQLRGAIERTGLHTMIDPMLALADAPSRSHEEWARMTDGQLNGRPFSDVGPQRVFRWTALGITWTVCSSNDYTTARAAERFCAAVQILLTELADDEVCLLPTEIRVTIDTRPSSTPAEERMRSRVEAVPSNDGRSWLVHLTPYGGPGSLEPERTHIELLTILSIVLSEASLLPSAQFDTAITDAFRRGLVHKLSIGRPYDELAEVISQDRYSDSQRHLAMPPADPAQAAVHEHPELAWRDGPGPGYTRAKAEEMLDNRYQWLPELITCTLPRLQATPAFQATAARLRREGWLDWHLLTAIVNISINHRLQATGLAWRMLTSPEARTAANALATEPESPDSAPVPLELFTPEAMERARNMALPPLLRHWGLELRQDTPDLPGITRLLGARFGYWTDDLPHDDPLQACSPK